MLVIEFLLPTHLEQSFNQQNSLIYDGMTLVNAGYKLVKDGGINEFIQTKKARLCRIGLFE